MTANDINFCSFLRFLCNNAVAFVRTLGHIPVSKRKLPPSGRSSGVEHNLAKVGVVSSNLIARSIYFQVIDNVVGYFDTSLMIVSMLKASLSFKALSFI